MSKREESQTKSPLVEKVFTAGKQVVDELIGARRSEPTVTILTSGTKRTDN